ncbi:MAG: alpha/beta hydrolase [Pseudomonadales bacterium]|nr:alpha/beta hydrolase [Pseudomonadales bacterium]
MKKYEFDPEFEKILKQLPTLSDFSTLEKIQKIRDIRERETREAAVADREDVTKADRMIPSRNGDPDIALRIYHPKSESKSSRPGIFEIHGGGFMLGDLDSMDAWCQKMASVVDAVVVSVDYRLAPEHPFPAGIEDCYAGLVWMADNADELGVDKGRIAIAGQSAGGGLAAGTVLMAKDRGGPPLCFQLLEIPELDDRLETSSMQAYTDTPLWNLPNAIWSWKHYLGPDHTGEPSAYAAPARAKDLTGLPPAYISTMEFDPLRDEGINYAVAMLTAGVSVELHSYPGTFHGSSMLASAGVSRRGAKEIVEALSRHLQIKPQK